MQYSQEELKRFFYYNMNEEEKEKINELKINDIIFKVESPTYKIKYIEGVGYITIGEGYLILENDVEEEHYFVKIFDNKEMIIQEIMNINDRK